MIKISKGKGVVDGEGVAVKGAWSGVVGVGIIKGSFQKHLKTGGGLKAKVVRRGGGFEGVTTPAPPENFNHTLIIYLQCECIEKYQFNLYSKYFKCF